MSALILRSLVQDARRHLGGSDSGAVRAVITVPAYFGAREREATFQAARLAGIEVLELLSEPVATALHYGVTRGPAASCSCTTSAAAHSTDGPARRPDGAQVVVTDGDSQLSGASWNDRIAEFLPPRGGVGPRGTDLVPALELARRDVMLPAGRPLALCLRRRRRGRARNRPGPRTLRTGRPDHRAQLGNGSDRGVGGAGVPGTAG
ncbi:Hsp70 family protein [Amycolatopsis sp. NPDC049252]|uniref:Hsp70 family protein n=1 Tax=Amycolatopsis sp. NPDC049252 TaxID=3363933 RepID=UPI003717B38D